MVANQLRHCERSEADKAYLKNTVIASAAKQPHLAYVGFVKKALLMRLR
jgi:hypothetical protein